MPVQSEMKHFGGFDAMTLKQHFRKKIMELEDEKGTVQVNTTIQVFSMFSMYNLED